MATSTYSIKIDKKDLEGSLKSIQQTQEETFSSFIKYAGKARQAEERFENTLKRQASNLRPLQKELAEINSSKQKNKKLTEEQTKRVAYLNKEIKRLTERYKIANKANKENTASLDRQSKALYKFNRVAKTTAKEVLGEIRNKQRNTNAINKEKSATDRLIRSQKASNAERNKGMNQLVRHIRRVESLVVGYYALTRGIDQLVTKGVMLNKSIEDSTVGIGALITANTRLDDTADVGERFQASMALSKRVVQDLRREAKETSATFPELTSVFQQAIGKSFGAGKAMGETVQDIIGNTITVSKQLTNIAGSTGMEMFKVNQEIRAMMSGDITKDAEIATMLGITSKDIDKAKKTAGGLFKFLQDELSVFNVLETEVTFSKLLARLGDATDTLRMETTAPIFEDLKVVLDDLTKTINENTAEWTENFHETYEGFKEVLSVVGEYSEEIKAVVKLFAIYKTAQIAFNVASSISAGIQTKLLAISRARDIAMNAEARAMQRKLVLDKAIGISTLQNISATKALTAVMRATPYGLALWGLAELAMAFTDTKDSVLDASMGIDQFSESIEKMTIAQAKVEKISLAEQITEQKEKVSEAHQDWRTTQRGRSETTRGLRSGMFRSEVSKDDVTIAKALKDTEQQRLDILLEKQKVLDETINAKKKGAKAEVSAYDLMTVEQLKLTREGIGVGIKAYGTDAKKYAGKDQEKTNKAIKAGSELLEEQKQIRSRLMLLGVKQAEVDDKAQKKIDKFWDKFRSRNKTEYQKLAIQYEDDLAKYGKTKAQRKLIQDDMIVSVQELAKEEIDSAGFSADHILKIKKQEAEEIAKIKKGAKLDPKKDVLITTEKAEKESKFNEMLSNQMANALTNGLQDALNGKYDFGKFTEGIANSIASAYMSSGITNLIQGQGKTGENLGSIGTGMAVALAIGTVTSLISKAEEEKVKPWEDAIEKFANAVEDFSLQAERARQFGFEGSALTADIGGAYAERSRLQAEVGRTGAIRTQQQEYEDFWGWLHSDENLNNAIKAHNDAVRALNNFDLGAEVAGIAQSAVGFFEGFQDLADSITGTNKYYLERVEEAKENLVAVLGEDVTRESFVAYINGMADNVDDLEELISIIATGTEGTEDFNQALEDIASILGEGTSSQQALDYANSINIVAESYMNGAESLSSVNERISTSTSDLLSSFESIADSMQSIIDISQSVTDQLIGRDYDTLLADAKLAQEAFMLDIYNPELAKEFADQVTNLQGAVSERTDASNFASLADYEFSKVLVAQQFEAFKASAELAGEQVDENIQLLQNIEDAISGADGTNDLTAQLLEAVSQQASTTDILAILNSQGGTALSVDAEGNIVSGFSKGGYTGDGGTNEVAGIVHKGEYVLSQKDLEQVGGTRAVESFIGGNRAVQPSGTSGTSDGTQVMIQELRSMNNRLASLENMNFEQLKTNKKQARESKTTNVILSGQGVTT
jgi:hypothetical protein